MPAYTAAMISTVSPGHGNAEVLEEDQAEREVAEAVERWLQAVEDSGQVRGAAAAANSGSSTVGDPTRGALR